MPSCLRDIDLESYWNFSKTLLFEDLLLDDSKKKNIYDGRVLIFFNIVKHKSQHTLDRRRDSERL